MGLNYLGTDRYRRRIGYGIYAECDLWTCHKEIVRSIKFVCGGEHGGSEHGCGRYFCQQHLYTDLRLCKKCASKYFKSQVYQELS